MGFETEIFGSKKFSDLLKDIYENQKKKDRQINLLIADLKPLITNISDAALLVPVIKDYMEVSVKNDEHLVKLAAVIQRMVSKTTEEGSSFLTDEEKDALLKEIKSIGDSVEEDNSVEHTQDHTKRTGI
jgi:mRNA-degrading endonuclease YafQ of YafQ-DinJ toxin-antitoxin module